MESVKDAISWFEIPVSDFARAKTFYQVIFDFEMPEMDMGSVKMGMLLSDQENGVGELSALGKVTYPLEQTDPKCTLMEGLTSTPC